MSMSNDISNLIGVTEQQFELLKAIDLASAEGQAKPKNIEHAYQKLTGKPIQKPNLFAQLRELQKQEFVTKLEGTYRVNNIKLKQSLLRRKQELSESIAKCDTLSNDVDKLFKFAPTGVRVQFLERNPYITSGASRLKEASSYKRVAQLPSITYSESFLKLSGMKEYAETIKERCKTGALEVKYIVSLRPRRAFLRALDAFKDKARAYKEVEECFENMIKLLKLPNLELRYSDAQLESISLFYPAIIVLPMRSSEANFIGGISIESEEVYDVYESMFENFWAKAVPLTEALIRKIAKQKLKELKTYINEMP